MTLSLSEPLGSYEWNWGPCGLVWESLRKLRAVTPTCFTNRTAVTDKEAPVSLPSEPQNTPDFKTPGTTIKGLRLFSLKPFLHLGRTELPDMVAHYFWIYNGQRWPLDHTLSSSKYCFLEPPIYLIYVIIYFFLYINIFHIWRQIRQTWKLSPDYIYPYILPSNMCIIYVQYM